MLIAKEMLVRATELSLTEVKAALVRNGYTDNSDMKEATFLGMNTAGTFVYEIRYDEGEEELSRGRIYVDLECKGSSKDFEFYACF